MIKKRTMPKYEGARILRSLAADSTRAFSLSALSTDALSEIEAFVTKALADSELIKIRDALSWIFWIVDEKRTAEDFSTDKTMGFDGAVGKTGSDYFNSYSLLGGKNLDGGKTLIAMTVFNLSLPSVFANMNYPTFCSTINSVGQTASYKNNKAFDKKLELVKKIIADNQTKKDGPPIVRNYLLIKDPQRRVKSASSLNDGTIDGFHPSEKEFVLVPSYISGGTKPGLRYMQGKPELFLVNFAMLAIDIILHEDDSYEVNFGRDAGMNLSTIKLLFAICGDIEFAYVYQRINKYWTEIVEGEQYEKPKLGDTDGLNKKELPMALVKDATGVKEFVKDALDHMKENEDQTYFFMETEDIQKLFKKWIPADQVENFKKIINAWKREQKTNGLPWWAITLIVVAVLIVVALTLYFVFTRMSKTTGRMR